jgi:hypothetical protein
MIKSKVVDLIKSRLGNRTDTGIDAKIVAELDAAQEALERFGDFTPWFLLSETATYTTVVGESRVPIPDDMLQEYEEGALFYLGEVLDKYEYDALRSKYYGLSGAPEAYALVNDYFILFPTPDAAYSIDMKYYMKDALISTISDTGENRWLKEASSWIIARTGTAIARFIKDTEAAALFASDEQRAQTDVYKRHIDRMERNVDRQSGDE